MHAVINSADTDLPAYVASLNPEQQEAVITTEGPLLVLAGAGTGKTKVLTTRVAHLINSKRAFPGQILAVTFTNKAAGEMRERVSHLLFGEGASPQEASSLWLGTFHSIGAKMLRRHAELVGLTPQFTILDDDDQQRLIKAMLADNNIDHTKFPTRAVLGVIQSWKDRALTPDKIPEAPGNYTLPQVAAKLYPIYQNRLKNLNCCDFGDLLLHILTIFQKHPPVLQQFAERFRYILVDEYQDTNVAQYLWLRLLAAYHKNLCCVGDDDQSIYGWRGAEVGNILKFDVDYPGAKMIRLERNYRSTSSILNAASGLIAHNESRLGKTLWTDSDNEGELVRVKSVWDDNEEARFVGEEIEAYQRQGIPLKEMAVLVRAGYQTRGFEDRFLTLGIPHKIVGGLRFYERREVRDAIAYLRIISQPHDDLALERIINTPKRSLGDTALQQLHTKAREMNGSLYAAGQQMLDRGELKKQWATPLDKLFKQFESWRERGGIKLGLPPSAPVIIDVFDGNEVVQYAPMPEDAAGDVQARRQPSDLSLAELTDVMLDESGYRAMWQADKSPEAAGRLDNLRELIRALGEFPNLTEFLEHVGLVTERTGAAADDVVSIMSLHAAKGLEFRSVFLAGWEEGIFPSQRTMDELGTAGLEEERRLAYVGITRARHHLTITHAANRQIYGKWQSSIPSRFLGEIPPKMIEFLDGGPYAARASGPAMFQREVESILGTRVEPAVPAFRKGARVFHQKFGNGVILNVEGDHLQIAFKHAGMKKILAEYVELAN